MLTSLTKAGECITYNHEELWGMDRFEDESKMWFENKLGIDDLKTRVIENDPKIQSI